MISLEQLQTEYSRIIHDRYKLVETKRTLPKGSLQSKDKNGHTYHYLAYRDGFGKVRYDYVKSCDVEKLSAEIDSRQLMNSQIRELNNELHIAERAIGRKNANLNHIRKAVNSVVQSLPELSVNRIVLFGSRATSKFNDNSDVDLLISFRDGSKVSTWDMSELRYALIDAIGLDVDLISEESIKDSGLELGETEVIFEYARKES